jgi:hypothetical protein
MLLRRKLIEQRLRVGLDAFVCIAALPRALSRSSVHAPPVFGRHLRTSSASLRIVHLGRALSRALMHALPVFGWRDRVLVYLKESSAYHALG